MSPCAKTSIKKSILDQPRYRKKPALLLFEIFVLDVIGSLSDEKRKGIQQINVQKMFDTKSKHWKSAVREGLKLSTTIETAILDDWYKKLSRKKSTCPDEFSKDFADRYFKKGSKLDTWTENSLSRAKARVAKHRKKS